MYQHVAKRGSYLLAGERDGVALVGRTDGAASGAHCQYAVGVLDRERGTLTLCPAGGHMARMEVRVPGVEYRDGPAEDAPEPQTEAERRALRYEKTKALVAEFGSVRRRRQMNTMAAAQVDAGRVAGADALHGMLGLAGDKAAAEGMTKDQLLRASEARRNVPPHDPGATVPWLAYPWGELCPEGAQASLWTAELLEAARDDAAREALAAGRRFNGYVRSRVPALAGIRDQGARARAARSLAYLHVLMEAHRMPGVVAVPDGGVAQLAEKHGVPEGALDAALATFFVRQPDPKGRDGEAFVRSQERKTLLVGYILVLALAAEGYVLEAKLFDDLRHTLKVEAKALSAHARELGCDVKAAKDKARDGSAMYKCLLLSDRADKSRRLQDCFPKPKLVRGPRK